MAILAAGDRALVTIVSSLFNQRIMSTFVYGAASVTGTPTQTAAFDALHTSFNLAGGLFAKYLACCGGALIPTQAWYQVISPSRYASYKKSWTAGAGTFSDIYLTANLAGVITRRGDQGNRHNVSTLHVPITQGEDSLQDGQIAGLLFSKLGDLANQVKAAVTTAAPIVTWNPVINNGAGAGDFTPITDTFPQATARTMRRRGLGLGI